jgi:hypothetical protein
MENGTLRQRKEQVVDSTREVVGGTENMAHPGGEIKHGTAAQIVRLILIITYFVSACFA